MKVALIVLGCCLLLNLTSAFLFFNTRSPQSTKKIAGSSESYRPASQFNGLANHQQHEVKNSPLAQYQANVGRSNNSINRPKKFRAWPRIRKNNRTITGAAANRRKLPPITASTALPKAKVHRVQNNISHPFHSRQAARRIINNNTKTGLVQRLTTKTVGKAMHNRKRILPDYYQRYQQQQLLHQHEHDQAAQQARLNINSALQRRKRQEDQTKSKMAGSMIFSRMEVLDDPNFDSN